MGLQDCIEEHYYEHPNSLPPGREDLVMSYPVTIDRDTRTFKIKPNLDLAK